VAQYQPDQLDRGLVVREVRLVSDALAHTAVQALDRVCRVDDSSHRGVEGEERDDLCPVTPPALGDGRESTAPRTRLEVGQSPLGRFGTISLVDRLERLLSSVTQ